MLKRRKFLEGMTVAGVVAVTAPLMSCSQGEQEKDAETQNQTVTVYRFQARKARKCNACQKHQHYKVFLDAVVAGQNRAHPGCNCRIVAQQMSLEYWDTISPFVLNGVIDLRAIFV